MAKTTFSNILITRNGSERPIFEALAAAEVYPGQLVMLDSNGKLALQTADDSAVPCWIVVEHYAKSGKVALEQSYAAGETTRYIRAQPGDEVYAFLQASETIAVGDELNSVTAGAFGEVVAGAAMGVALEAVTTTASTSHVRIALY